MVAFTSPGMATDSCMATETRTLTENRTVAPHRAHDSELTRRIDCRTFRQVHDLHVLHESGRVVLRGRSQSYYVKQLATHAVLDMMPDVVVDNSIDVTR